MNNLETDIQLSELKIGDWFYTKDLQQIELFQLLEIQSEFLVKAFWPIGLEESYETAELRTACTNLSLPTDSTVYFLRSGTVNSDDLQEVNQYKRILAGKEEREKQFKELVNAAISCIKTNHLNDAIALLTEAAPYSKLDVTIYQKRGLCYFKLEKYPNAIADFEYVLNHHPDQETIELCIKAYEFLGNIEKAKEKRALLI